MQEILARDPRFDCPRTAPKLPPLYRANAFTRPRLVDGRALPLAAMQALGEMLKLSPVDAPYAGLADVRDACDPRSLADLAWDMARGWELAGAKKADAWMFDALVHLADDEIVRRTTPAIKSPRVLEVLAQIGSDAAIMELATIAARAASGRKSVYFSSASAGEQQLEAVASSKGWTIDELDERVTPTLGTDAMGGLDLDYGPRKVRVGFDESLSPHFQVDGERVRMMSPKRKTDDADRVKEARALWSDLAEDVSVLADRRIRAMERAMVNGRRWDANTFRSTWIEHPLMIHLARDVVWIARGAGGPRPFRVAEDKTFADQNDDAFDLADAESIEIAHPLILGPGSIARFSQLFADYRLIQPFPQLAREVVSLTKDEAEKDTVTRSRAPRFADGTLVPLASVDPVRIAECLRDAEAAVATG